jgi:hypothetical protein
VVSCHYSVVWKNQTETIKRDRGGQNKEDFAENIWIFVSTEKLVMSRKG